VAAQRAAGEVALVHEMRLDKVEQAWVHPHGCVNKNIIRSRVRSELARKHTCPGLFFAHVPSDRIIVVEAAASFFCQLRRPIVAARIRLDSESSQNSLSCCCS